MKKLISRPGKSWDKENNENVWKNPGNSSKVHTKLELSIFLGDLYPQKHFLAQIVPESPGKF